MAGHRHRLVGRDRELTTLSELFEAAQRGRGRAAVILGEPGIGKTAMVEAFAASVADRPVRVTWGRCAESDAPAFWPWRQALRALNSSALTNASSRAAGSPRPELFAQVVDELAAADRPALVVLEDIQWADPASLALMRFVTDAVPGLPLLLVATMRDAPIDASPEATELLRSLPAGVERVALSGLGSADVAEVVAQVVGHAPDAELVTRIAERCGGNPFFVREVARLHASRGQDAVPTVPAGVQQVLERRLARLGQSCRDLLALAAVAGEPEPALLAEFAGLPLATVLHGLSEAVTARLLDADGHRFRFAHDLVRETVYAGQPPERLAKLHRRIAEVWESRAAASRPESVAATLATHWRRAAGADAPGNAAAWALAAAREARERMGYEQAVGFYRWALESATEDELSIGIELGQAQILAGELETARKTLRDAARTAARLGRASDLARAVLALGTGIGGFEVEIGDQEQIGLLEEALSGLEPEPTLRAAVLARLSLATAWTRDEAERAEMAEEAIALARAAGDHGTQVAALAAWCDARSGPDHIDERLVQTEGMIAAAEASGDPISVLLARRFRVIALGERGDFAGFDAEVAAYAQNADRLRLPLYGWYVPLWRGTRALMNGDFAAVRRALAQVEDLGRRADSANALLMALSLRFWLAWFSNDVEAIAEFVRDPFVIARDPYLEVASAGLLAAIGEVDEARRSLGRVTAGGISLPRDAEYLGALWPLADGAILLDDRDAAELVYRALEPYGHCWVIAGIGGGCCGQVAHQLGRLATYLGQYDQARGWLDQALTAHRDAGAALLIQQTEAALAELAAAQAHPKAATQGPSDEGEFRRTGRVWQVRWDGVAATVPDSKGMRDLAMLLASPEQEVHALDLVEAAGGPSAAAAGGHTGERLDKTARTAYRQRLADLEDELAEAEQHADTGRVEALRSEQQFIAAELAGALGLGGRAVVEGDSANRARKAVTMRIRTALKAIGEVCPGLARHLERSVTTGRFCAYRPERPVHWRL